MDIKKIKYENQFPNTKAIWVYSGENGVHLEPPASYFSECDTWHTLRSETLNRAILSLSLLNPLPHNLSCSRARSPHQKFSRPCFPFLGFSFSVPKSILINGNNNLDETCFRPFISSVVLDLFRLRLIFSIFFLFVLSNGCFCVLNAIRVWDFSQRSRPVNRTKW